MEYKIKFFFAVIISIGINEVTLWIVLLSIIYSVFSACNNCTKSDVGIDPECCQDGCLKNVICRDVAENDLCDTPEYCTDDGKCPEDQRIEDGAVQWDFIGNSCQFRLWIPQCTDKSKQSKWTKISPQDITEVGLGAKKKLSLIGNKWEKSQNVQDVSRFSVEPDSYYSLSTNISTQEGHQLFVFTAYWFGEESSYTLGGQTYTTKGAGSNVEISVSLPYFEESLRMDPDAHLNGQEKVGPVMVLLLLSLLILFF